MGKPGATDADGLKHARVAQLLQDHLVVEAVGLLLLVRLHAAHKVPVAKIKEQRNVRNKRERRSLISLFSF